METTITDISTLTDLKELKAMAYDQIGARERAEGNLNSINTRITQLLQVQVDALATDAPEVGDEDLGIEDTPGAG